MMKNIFYILTLGVIFAACGSGGNNANDNRETAKRGSFKLIVDESYKPIIDQQIAVFESTYPEAKVNVEYKTEWECFRMLESDSATRMIITSRKPTEKEDTFFNSNFERGISYSPVALDAVAVITHPSFNKDMLTLDEIRDALLGKSKIGLEAVFDGNKETSNARFLKDSLLKTDTLPSAIGGVKGNQAVIDFVARNTNALGFVGVSWIGNPNDPEQFSFLKNVKVMGVQCQANCASYSYPKPYQANMANRHYPLTRGIYYTVKNDYGGVATNFAKFLELEQGQMIFNKSYLVGSKLKVLLTTKDVQMTK